MEHENASDNTMYSLALIKKSSAISALKNKIKYEAEFSSIASACIRKNGSEAIIATVFDGL